MEFKGGSGIKMNNAANVGWAQSVSMPAYARPPCARQTTAAESFYVMAMKGPVCRGICECLTGALGNSTLLNICFRVKGNSTHWAKQMDQEKGVTGSWDCDAPGYDGAVFKCEGDQMTCMKNHGVIDFKQDTIPKSSSSNHSVPIENSYTFVSCDRSGADSNNLTCHINKNASRPGTCTKESLAKCHYKSAGNKQKRETSGKVSRHHRCPPGWSFKRKRCHKHVDDLLTFDDAYTKCRQMRAFLTLGTVGLNDEILPQEWGHMTHWAKSNGNGTTDCIVINSTQTHSSKSCDGRYSFFCYKEVFKFLHCKEAPAVPVEPTEAVTTELTTVETTSSTTPTTITTPTTKTTPITTAKPTTKTTPTTTTTPTTKTTPSSTVTPTSQYQHAPGGSSSPEEKLNSARVALSEAKVQIESFVKSFTTDNTTLALLDDIIDTPPSFGPDQPGSNDAAVTMATEMVEKMDSLVDSLAEVVSGPGMSLTIENDQLVLKVIPICSTCSSTAPGPRLEAGINNDSYVVKIPASATGDGATAALSALSSIADVMPANVIDDHEETNTADDGDDDTTTESGNQTIVTHEIASLVATVSVKRWDGSDLQLAVDHPFEIIFNNKDSSNQVDGPARFCCYWRPDEAFDGGGAWSTEGCVTKVNRTHTTCQCTHLTSFAVLMRFSEAGAPQSASVRKIQDYMTYVGCGLSMTCLAIMLIVFTIQKLYRSDRNIIHMNLASAIFVSQGVFLFGIERVEPWVVCKIIGICLHFFLLATFFWMLVEGIYLISKTTSTKNRFLKTPTYVAIGWGGPAAIVAITAGVAFKSYTTDKMCWLSTENGGIWAFIGPAIGVIVMNISLLCQVIRVFLSLKTNMKKAHVDRIWLALRAMLLTLPLLGGTWLFGILSFNSQTVFFSYIFIILNSLQGVFIFILYCLMNDEVKKVVEKKLNSISGRASNGRSTKSTT
ncbi:cadherin EGF LAG seven-pass G-type receptor 1-like [Lytechinus variegatus]|uniref:cadherin EGF LAG seven-pass G-type receptor 1-like n=1 Tax=Lytechinus variegatus TaxID=7654 RepID=UPI001BB1F8E5|nr:cadherin EGF LAG seven-pass G-type receptor 1-like [Lytechinus variegatus]